MGDESEATDTTTVGSSGRVRLVLRSVVTTSGPEENATSDVNHATVDVCDDGLAALLEADWRIIGGHVVNDQTPSSLDEKQTQKLELDALKGAVREFLAEYIQWKYGLPVAKHLRQKMKNMAKKLGDEELQDKVSAVIANSDGGREG